MSFNQQKECPDPCVCMYWMHGLKHRRFRTGKILPGFKFAKDIFSKFQLLRVDGQQGIRNLHKAHTVTASGCSPFLLVIYRENRLIEFTYQFCHHVSDCRVIYTLLLGCLICKMGITLVSTLYNGMRIKNYIQNGITFEQLSHRIRYN